MRRDEPGEPSTNNDDVRFNLPVRIHALKPNSEGWCAGEI